ncbi:MAG: hypothetical protein R2684_14085 [Pyrinomonadaceae bacterium]
MTEEKDLFKGYEIGGIKMGSRMYKIIAISAAMTILPLIALGQTNLFSRSACQSPFVGTVCEVLDTVYVGSKLLAKDTGYREDDYSDIKLQEDNESIWIEELANAPKFEYPDGYFEVANRDELLAQQALENGLPDSGFNNTLPPLPPINNTPIAPPKSSPPIARAKNPVRRPVFPKRNPNAVKGDLNDDPLGDIMADADGKNSEKEPKTKPSPKTQDNVANNKKPDNPLDKNTAKSGKTLSDIEINKKPLYDFADIVLAKVVKKEVDLSSQFKVQMNGVVNPDGMLDPNLSKFVSKDGDEAMIALGMQAIEKVGVSGWLRYLADAKANRLNIMFGQNADILLAEVTSDLGSENEAKSQATGLRNLVNGVLFAHKNGLKELKDDEVQLLRAAKFANDGKLLKITFQLEKPVAHKIINTRLAEYKLKKEEELKKGNSGKPSGMVDKPDASVNAGR